jgi:hypothetical protein
MTSTTTAPPRNLLRSTGAVLLGLVLIFVLSLGIDQVLHSLGVYPPWGEPMRDPSLNLLALSYRIVIAILGCYVTARVAPRHPMRHAMILGCIGVVLSLVGVLGAMRMDLGPLWYPMALVLTSLPCAWVGGALCRARLASRDAAG